jgi:hypothetical protein
MASQATREKIGKVWADDPNDRRSSDKVLSDLFESKIAGYVKERIAKEIIDKNEQKEMAARILEIDIVKRIVTKLAKAYKDTPVRKIVGGSEKDNEILDWYLKNTNLKDIFFSIDKNYNNFKESLIQCFYHVRTNKPYFKAWSPNDYIAVSDDTQDMTNATIFATYYGQTESKQVLLFCVSENEAWIQDLKGDIYPNETNPMNENIYGSNPFIYIKNTSIDVMPYPDDSMISVATLIPMLCGDINYAIKYMSYGIVYGINIKEDLIRRGPNAFWNLLPFDESSTIAPTVGTLKPDIDIKDVFDGIMMQLQLWLNARGISSSIFGYNTSSISSGVSKMIDEADVSDIVKSNQVTYAEMEKNLFDFIMYHGHEVWKLNNPEIPQQSFTPGCYVETVFVEPEIIKTRQEMITEVSQELKAGLTSRKRAIKKLNPNLSDDEIDSIMREMSINQESQNDTV